MRGQQNIQEARKNENIHRLTSTKLSEIVESSVQQLMYNSVPIITSPIQTKRTSSTTLHEQPSLNRYSIKLTKILHPHSQ